MISIHLNLLDLDTGLVLDVTIPTNLAQVLSKEHEYYIVSASPSIDDWMVDDVWELNRFADEVNSENPEMTAEYVDILLSASGVRDVMNESFIRKLKENDFMFEDITDCDFELGIAERAAKHLVKNAHVPFDKTVSRELMNVICAKEIEPYIDWTVIWREFIGMGFRLVTVDDGAYAGTYVIHWE